MEYIIGVDLGTSGTKTVLFDREGNVVASATEEYPMYQPQNGWAEQAPEDWWRAAAGTCRQVLEQSGIDAKDVKGLGLSGQMHGLVMLDKNCRVLRRSIIWCDQRSGKQCDEITERVGRDRLIAITANPALTGFTAAKLLWVRENQPDIYAQCAHILLPKDYVRYMLTGEFATEALLAKVYESPEVTGTVTAEAAKLTGLRPGTPVVGGAGDNAAAAVGTGVVSDGKAFTTLGTSGVVFAHTDKLAIDSKGRVHTFCCAVPGAWHVMGVTQGAGLSLKWFRDNFCYSEIVSAQGLCINPYTLLDKQAAQSPIGCNKLLYLPYLMGERTPHLDPDCRGVFFGLSAMHVRSDLLRAVMEGVVYSQRDSLEVLREMGVDPEQMLACGGGGTSPLWRQMLADVYNRPVQTVKSKEGPALGAAILAGVGAGLYPSVQEACDQLIQLNPPQEPVK